MAIIQLGVTLSEMSGALGNVVALKLPNSGNVLRERITPFNPNTSFQQDARSNLADAARYWGDTLTQAQRDGWDTYADSNPVPGKFGGTVKLSGADWFARCNVNLVNSGGAIGDQATAPASPAPAAASGMTINSLSVTTFTMQWPTGDGATYHAWATPSLSAGRQPQDSDFRLITSAALGSDPQAADIYTPYQNRIGTPVAGRRIGARIYQISSEGLSSLVAEDAAIVQ